VPDFDPEFTLSCKSFPLALPVTGHRFIANYDGVMPEVEVASARVAPAAGVHRVGDAGASLVQALLR
jgi:hypothetical protein